eukprot:INCI4785.1.p1 GENE.INCI4785.1~~INCI4785.1.p1  ORF type:complete len:110 (+),score=23.29 INCI4785.1:173-502(+)
MLSLALSTCGSVSMSWRDAYQPLLAKLGIAAAVNTRTRELEGEGGIDTNTAVDAAVDARPTPGAPASDAFSHDNHLSNNGSGTSRREEDEDEDEENDDNMNERGPLLRN